LFRRSLGSLAQHPRIDANRIGIMGFSKGAVAAVYSSNQRFQKLYAPEGVKFATHVGFYTPCNTTYRDDDKTTRAPIRLFQGIADDWVAIGPCRDYIARLKAGRLHRPAEGSRCGRELNRIPRCDPRL